MKGTRKTIRQKTIILRVVLIMIDVHSWAALKVKYLNML
jgi:hypothetical protein